MSHRPGHGIVSGNVACDIVEGKGFDAGLGYSSPLHPAQTCAIDVAPVKAHDAPCGGMDRTSGMGQ